MLQLKNMFKVSYKSIMKNRMRSLLTSLGIIIGVSAVIVMVGIGSGSQQRIEQEIASMGDNMIIVFPSFSQRGGVSRGAGSFNRMTMEDVEAIQKDATCLKYISAIVMSSGQVIANGKNWNTSIQGVDPDYQHIRMWKLKSGEFFTEKDIRARKKVAVIGQTVAENVFGNIDPVGQKIRIRNTPFKVIGVLEPKGQDGRGQDQDDIIYAPSTTVLTKLKGDRYINMINASATTLEDIPKAQEELADILRREHKIGYGKEDDFMVANQTSITEMASETSRIMTMLLGAVAAVSLIVGGIGIMNIMLVSVTERTREIGIRLSLGARSGDILTQFLLEAVVLSLTGGLIGIILSLAIAGILNTWTEIYTLINPLIAVLSFSFSGAVGIFFGFYPARKASVLNPIDALRYE
ncbi:MAG: ABC transporter permease [Calditrichaceae bacterium]|nr:ABC transporter permease [Calditrichaceae bacterium]MBN2708977.1 ABC transporter permease [Calditrichaceae bacterium]RQV93351.1 MAG: FtsX-like permease family protein [Calditrichota bacterium]